METIWRWGADLIIAIQAIHNPILDVFFNAVTSLGSEAFYLLLLPLIYWCLDKRLAQRSAYLFLFSAYGNAALKGVFRHPRPFGYDPRVLKLDLVPAEVLGYGLPSGHSQSTLALWGYLAARLRRRWLWVLALGMVILIAFSRIYLGVHFPSDVLGGLVVGAAWLGLFLWLEPRATRWLAGQSMGVQATLAVLVPAIWLLAYASGDATAAMGALIGLGIGIVAEGRTLRFQVAGPFWQRAARFMVGITVAVILREGLKLVFPGQGAPLYALFRVIRYGLIGLWVALLAPWAFQRMGLMAGREAGAP